MNKNLNLVDILKECPKGTKLYSTIHGEVEFEKIIIDDTFPIKFSFKVNGKNSDLIYAASVSIDGKYATKYNGECILFPSKDQRDWSKFNIEPKFDINTLKPFDKVLVRDGYNEHWRCSIFSYIYKLSSNKNVYVCACHWNQCVPYNEDTRHLVGTTEMSPKKYITWEE
jgi:hypothetical protein